jgi:hypothetical protein
MSACQARDALDRCVHGRSASHPTEPASRSRAAFAADASSCRRLACVALEFESPLQVGGDCWKVGEEG